MNKTVFFLGAMILLSSATASADEEVTRKGALDATGAERLTFDGRVGSVDITGTDGDTVEWEIRIEPGDDWSGSDVSPSEVEIRAERKGAGLRLEDVYPEAGDINLVAHWTIRMPARVALDGELNVGEAIIRGLAGGTEFELNVGELTIEALKGDVTAETNVGELHVVSRTTSVGRVDLETNIGDVSFDYDGGSAEKSGFIGKEIHYRGDGEDDFDLETNVGEVRLTIESD